MSAEDWTALGTIVIALFTIVLAISTTIQAVLTRRAIKDGTRQHWISNRAFVHFSRLEIHWRYNPQGQVIGGFAVVFWKNSGATTTRNARARVNWTESPGPDLPTGFGYETGDPVPTTVPPHTEVGAGTFSLPQDFLQRTTQERVFVWGRIDYDDVIGGTNRFTRFCVRYMAQAADPATGEVPVTIAQYGPHNGTEEG